MRFPAELWENEQDRELAESLIPAFEQVPLLLTDGLANAVFVNEAAEGLLGERAEALVNRLSFSLIGFGKKGKLPEALVRALRGEGPSWRGVVDLSETEEKRLFFAEASAILSGRRFVCGVIRLSAMEAMEQ